MAETESVAHEEGANRNDKQGLSVWVVVGGDSMPDNKEDNSEESTEPSLRRKSREWPKTKASSEGGKTPKNRYSASKKDICKMARNSGNAYVKLKGKDKGTFVGKKEIGPDCLCPNKCYECVGEMTIRRIFKDFWALGDYNSQNAYLFGLINVLKVKRRYTKSETFRRNFTVTYSVKKEGENVSVCKKAFLNMHGLQRNGGRVNNLTKKMKEGESVPPPDRRGRHGNRPNAYSHEAVLHVKNHLSQCPTIERKKNPSKPSKNMEFTTKRCYELYVTGYCKERNLLPVSLDKFRRVWWEEGYKNRRTLSKRIRGGVMPSDVTIRKLSAS